MSGASSVEAKKKPNYSTGHAQMPQNSIDIASSDQFSSIHTFFEKKDPTKLELDSNQAKQQPQVVEQQAQQDKQMKKSEPFLYQSREQQVV